MTLIDADGTVTGSSVNTGTAGVIAAIGGLSLGGSDSGTIFPQGLDHILIETLTGSSNVSGQDQAFLDVSGLASGAGTAADGTLLDAFGGTVGSTIVFGNARRVRNMRGYSVGGSIVGDSIPYPIFGTAIVSGVLEIIHVGYPICQTPPVKKSFRWGQSFGVHDLEIQLVGAGGNPIGPTCVHFTMYQIPQGCVPIQRGLQRRPGNSGVGKYYATGTAGECGQPGLWLIRWSYQITSGAPTIEKDCYFYVLDSTICAVPGDTLVRECKYGWD